MRALLWLVSLALLLTGCASENTPGSYALAPGGYYEFSSTHAVSVYATTAIAFSAARY